MSKTPSTQAAQLNWAALADRYGELDEQVARFKPVKDEYERLAKLFRENHAEKAAAESFSIAGQKFIVTLGPKKEERDIPSIPKLYRKLKTVAKMSLDLFLQNCTFPLKKLDAFMSEEEQIKQGLVVKERTGSRAIDVVRREAA